MYKSVYFFVSAWLLAFTGFRDDDPSRYYDPKPFCTTPAPGECPIEGRGKDGAAPKNAYLNTLKNRDIAPKESDYIHTDLNRVMTDLPQKIGTGRAREKWEDEWKKTVAKYEKNAVTVYGYIDKIESQGAEECNCYSKTEKDHHLWLGNRRDGNEGNRYRHDMTAELNPRMKSKQESWDDKIEKIAENRDSVRVSGWLMFDNEHYGNLLPVKDEYTDEDYRYKTRITLWEVHPVHKIEIWDGGEWKEVDEVY